MDHRLHTLKSALVFLFIIGFLFAALALLPVMAQKPGGGEAQAMAPSTTGYLIDDGSAGFTRSATGWTAWAGGGYGSDLVYADTTVNPGSYWAQWRPDLYGGNYEVLVHYFAHSTYYSKAQYTIYYYGGTRTIAIDQQMKADGTLPLPAGEDSGWLSLGEFRFLGGLSGYVRLTNATATGATGQWVIADAVKFAPLVVWVDDDYCSGYACVNDGQSWGVTAFDNIQDALNAVGNKGTINVKTGTYVGPVAITKGITLTAAAGQSPVITVTTDTAVQILADRVTVKGFTIRSHAGTRGIANYDPLALPPWLPVSSFRVLNNVVRDFQLGIEFYQAKGEISSNTIYSNTDYGILIQQSPPSDPGGTIIASNVLYANGAGGGPDDFDIAVWDSYTDTKVLSNTITGGLGASEACISVLNEAKSLEVAGNTLTGCTESVLIRHNGIPVGADQIVNLYRNVISGGTRGVRVRKDAGGSYGMRQIVIGGSVANSNRIFGDTGNELDLMGYSADFTATHNYWGVCNWRAIEDEIRHDYDVAGLGKVLYEPALCVPTSINITARPTTIPADGISTAVITATVTDFKGDPAMPGTMIGITTSLGSVPYAYVEGEGGEVTRTPGWGFWADARASAGQFAFVPPGPPNTLSWVFTGTAVSLVYLKWPAAGTADVLVDGTVLKTINMSTPVPTGEWRLEEVISSALSATGVHTIEVRHNIASVGNIYVDALRSGATVASNGRIVTSLTSVPISDTASVWATVYDGRIFLGAPPYDVLPLLADSVDVAFQGTDVYVYKVASRPEVSPGKNITYTVTYGNSGPATAKGVVITDTLPLDFQYVSQRTVPTLPLPAVTDGITLVWNVGELAPRATGFITVVARPNPALPWPSVPTARANAVVITSIIRDDAAANDSAGATVNVVPNVVAAITVTAYPTEILADGAATAVITAEVRDAYNNPILDGTAITFTTSLPGTIFQPGGTQTHLGTTTGGVATTILQAGTVAGNAPITVKVGALQGTGQVQLLALEPHTVTMSANPWSIPVSNGEISTTLRITVTDMFGNLVRSIPVTLTTDAGVLGANGMTGSELIVTTTNGIALAKLGSAPTMVTATVTAAITNPLSTPAVVLVPFVAGEPFTVTSDFSPATIRVCGGPEGTAYITVTVWDKFGNLVADGTPVMFSVNPGTRGEARPRDTSTVAGVAYSSILSKSYKFPTGQREGSLEVYISAGRGEHQINYSQLITLTPGLVDHIDFILSPSPVKVQQQTHIEARVLDCAGNGVDDGTAVAFETNTFLGSLNPLNTTTNLGLALTTFQANCAAQPAPLTATVGSQIFTTTIPIDPGTADWISVDISPSTILNCGGQAVVTATVRDACANLVKDGTQVLFAQQYGFVSLSRYIVSTQRGIVTATVTADQNKRIEPADWPWGFEQINAKSGTAMPGWANLTIQPGLARRIVVSATPGEIPINGDVNGYDIAVSAIVADCSSTPVVDATLVRLETSKGVFLESGQWHVDRWTIGGLVEATLTSQSVAGDVIITATASSNVGTAEVYFIPGEPWYIDVWSTPREWMYADGRSRLDIWARVTDEYHNPVVEGTTLAFVTDYGHFVNSGDTYTTTTMADGLATAVLVADVEPHTALVRAITLNYRHGYTFVHMLLAPEVKHIYVPVIRKNSTR